MSTSAVYSPRPPTPTQLPTTSTETAASITKSRFTRGRSAGATENGSSVSPTRTVAAGAGPLSTRSRRSQTSKEPSPEKMSTSEILASSEVGTTEVLPHNHIDPTKASTAIRTSEGEIENGEAAMSTHGEEGDNHRAPIPAPTNDTVSVTPPKSQKIMLVIGRKRKADDDMTASSEIDTPPSHASKTPEVDPAPSVEPTSIPPVQNDKQLNDTTSSAPNAAPQPSDSTKVVDNAPAPAPAITVVQEIEAPKRAPRKRRKWLRKGEVDPDDPKAVAEQRARHALIDAALEALDQQEQMILDNTHPQLLALWDEVERRHDIQLAYNKYHEECEMRELDHLYLQELGQIRCQFRQDCEDLSTVMMFENRRTLSRLEAERVYHDRGKPATKRMYTNMPTLREGRGSGGWIVPTTRLLSKGTRRKTLVQVDDHVRHRVDVSVNPRMASTKEAEHDLILLGLREPPSESSESEYEEEEEEEQGQDYEHPPEQLPIDILLEHLPEPAPVPVSPPPVLPPPPKAVHPRARPPSPPQPMPSINPAPVLVVPRKASRGPPPGPPPMPHPVDLEPRGPSHAFSRPPPPPPSHAPMRRMDMPEPYARDRPPLDLRDRPLPLDPRDRPPPLGDPRDRPPPLGDLRDRPPALGDPRDRPPPPLNDLRDRPPALDHRDRPLPLEPPRGDRLPPHYFDRPGPGYDRPFPPPPMDHHSRPPPLPSGSRAPMRYDDRGDWWGPRDRHVHPPGGYMPPPHPMPQTATAPPSAHPQPQPQTATPAGYWGAGPPKEEWNDFYYDRRPYPGAPPPPAFAGSRP